MPQSNEPFDELESLTFLVGTLFENFSTKHQLPPPLERGTPAGFLSIGKLERVECEGGHG